MVARFTRRELYDLVWSAPMKSVAAQFSVSDVGLSKACRRYDIPVPERGYWAKLRANKKVSQRPLPARGPGMTDEVVVGAGNRWSGGKHRSDQEIIETVPEPPVFDREIEDVIAEVRRQVGAVKVRKVVHRYQQAIAKLIAEDDARREKAATASYVMSWEQPRFESPFERRRLRLLNAIFVALNRCGMSPSVRGREGRDLSVRVNDTHVPFSVDDANAKLVDHPSDYQPCRNPSGRMKVLIKSWRAPNRIRQSWEDTKSDKVEQAATEIVVALIVAGEQQYREGTLYSYEWLVSRRNQLIEEARRRQEEAERQEIERLRRLEQERVGRLLTDAADLRRARDIREYVKDVESLCAAGGATLDGQALREWVAWATAQADRLDPVLSRRFLRSIDDPDG